MSVTQDSSISGLLALSSQKYPLRIESVYVLHANVSGNVITACIDGWAL